ncbi:MAG: hypothetical protein K8S99_15575 [Planctomycetes bacterium]|nr:hypothetical protein [Planctomycetota bacterium]
MAASEWSRSRYWLCHFLNSRHERGRIDWSSPAPTAPPEAPGDSQSIRHLAGDILAGCVGTAALAVRVAQRYPEDPAFVQSVRLMVKERMYHANLMGRVRERLQTGSRSTTGPRGWVASMAALPGVRFELSLLLLADLLDTAVLRRVETTVGDPAVRQAVQTVLRERRGHALFNAERLTLELAELNFVRRNLRRLRLRMMFATGLAWTVARSGRLLGACGVGRRAFAAEAWRGFSDVLERIVPYRRDALLSALMSQREHPYDKSADTGW